MYKAENIQIRKATLGDKEFILSMLPELNEFGPPPWRNADEMVEIDTEVLTKELTTPNPDNNIFIAENHKKAPLGFIFMQTNSDYYKRSKHAHIADIVVAPRGRGQGVGKLLLNQAEDWAKKHGYNWLTLNVFDQNKKARRLYEKMGFGGDMIKYVKELSTRGRD